MTSSAPAERIENLLDRRSDLSTFLVHFTRDNESPAKENLLGILRSCKLEARNVYGLGKELSEKYPAVAETQRSVCFTETPLEHTWMMCRRIEGREFQFKEHGLAFTKSFARRRGVNPVWYIDTTPGTGVPGGRDWLTNPIKSLIADAESAEELDQNQIAACPIFKLTPFFETMGSHSRRKEFWWEREWRHVGDFSFDFEDIVVAFAPALEHPELRQALKDDPGSLDRCPTFIDPTWGLERIIGTLAGISDLAPFPERVP